MLRLSLRATLTRFRMLFSGPFANNGLLLEDNVSYILLEDDASVLLLE